MEIWCEKMPFARAKMMAQDAKQLPLIIRRRPQEKGNVRSRRLICK